MPLSKIKTTEKSGNERFHLNGEALDSTLLSFWQWHGSDIMGNALRGVLAEYIVSIDVGCESSAREEWDAHDLISPTGAKIEVKSCSYIQSWAQRELSRISFTIAKTKGWDASTNGYSDEFKRQADVYVFCILAHKDKVTVDPLNLAQWDFYVLSTETLNERVGNQKTITLSSLLKLEPEKCKFGEIGKAIDRISS